MTSFGANLLTQGQLWRIFADIVSRITCMFASRATHSKVGFVAGPSSKMPAAHCQNRYPSPSKRSGLSRVRPLPFGRQGRHDLNVILESADCGQAGKKGFARPFGTGETDAAKQFRLREGSSTCSRNPGSSPLSQWLALRPALRTIPSAGLPALPAAQSSLTRWAAMPLSVPSLAVRAASSATTSASAVVAADLLTLRAYWRASRDFRAIGAFASVAFRISGTGGQRPASST